MDGGFPGLNAKEQKELQSRIEKKQAFEFMEFVNNVTDRCFDACIDDFGSRALTTRESTCLSRCFAKTMATQKRVSERMQEQNQLLMQQQQQIQN